MRGGEIMAIGMKETDSPKKNFYYTDVEDVRDYKDRMKDSRKKKCHTESFGEQEVDLNRYLISPAGLEGLMYTIYFLLIPYAFGALFLFFFIAHISFDKFLQLDLASLFIVWAIGYELIAVLLLFMILLSYLSYLKKSSKRN